MPILLLVLLLQVTASYGLDCYVCIDVNVPSECHTVTTCAADNFCFTELSKDNNRTNAVMGCKHKGQCSVVHERFKCTECCSQPSCNNLLYSHVTQMVDGNWAGWSTWSACDTTCGNGSSTRTRTCTNPSPAHGGSDCTGISKQTGACNLQDCPDQRKNTVNRTSSVSGNGAVNETNLCQDDLTFDCARFSTLFSICDDTKHAKLVCKKFCKLCDIVDGHWAGWSTWSACDTTCGNGSSTRTRTCTNPSPAHGGSDCTGISKQTGACNLKDCPVQGNWSSWSAWGSCSKTCGVGLQRRDRSCSNPYPSRFEDRCYGEGNEYRTCLDRTCVVRQVAFTVHTPTGALVGSTPTFSRIVLNDDGAYNTRTGRFTCPIPGIYLFTVNLMRDDNYRNGGVWCNLHKNSAAIAGVYSHQYIYESSSVSLFLHLSVGDLVDLQCYGWDYVNKGDRTLFSGALVRAD